MLSLYRQAVIENLINNVEDYHLNYKIDIYDSSDENLKAKIVDGALLPIIAVATTQHKLSDDISNYSSNQISQLCKFSVIDINGNRSTKEYDYTNAIPMWLSFHFTILAKDISHIVDLEKFISETYNINRNMNLQNPDNSNEVIPFEISIDNEVEIERIQNDKFSIFQSIITLKCSTYIPSISSSYHPAQIQFDKKLQMSKLEDLQSLCSLYNIFSSTSDIVTDKANNLKNIKSAQENICATFNIPLSYSQDKKAIQEIYKIMEDEDCDIKVAIEKFKQQLKEIEEADKKETERIKKVEEKFSGIGDKALNHYTDAIIEDLKKRLSVDCPISVFGGSSFMEYFIQCEKNTLTYPIILVYTEVDFSFSHQNYTNITTSGNPIIHNYALDTLPIEYGIKIEVYAKNKEIKTEIEKQIVQLYTNDVQLQISDYKYPNEINLLHLSVETTDKYDRSIKFDDEFIPVATIKFKKFQLVYYQNEYNLSNISNNQRLQARLFQLSEFYYMCEYKIRNEAMHKLRTDYKGLFPERTTKKKSLFGMAFGELSNIYNEVATALNTEEYKSLKASIQRGAPIDKELFDKALNTIVKVYPVLYDRTVQGWSYEQIQADLNKYADLLNKKWNEICNLLAVSCISMFKQLGMSGDDNQLSDRIHKGLLFYSETMLAEPGLSIKSCNRRYDDYLRRQEEQDREAEANVDEFIGAVRGSSSSGGFFGNMLSAAGGVAIGNKISGNSKKKNEKPDLMGSAGCMYNRRDSSDWKVHCDVSCPLYWKCKRGAGS